MILDSELMFNRNIIIVFILEKNNATHQNPIPNN